MAKIIGIDLGTTNSCVAVVDVTKPQFMKGIEN
jgi:molecular chaperone DnaK (HSP70)